MYVLEDGVPKLEPNIHVYANWFATADRNVAKTTVLRM